MRVNLAPGGYYHTLFKLMIPITIQQFFNSGLALVDSMLVGQLGDTAVASVSLAFQVFFVLFLIYFGINTGSAIFTAQFWGNNDQDSIRKVVGLNILINISVGIIFTLVAQLIPEKVLAIYSADPEVIALGARYLRVFSMGYIFSGISYGLFGILRSTENVRIPMIVNSSAIILNTVLGFILIFGHLGFPKMGVMGAAFAGVTAKTVELIAILGILIYSRSFLIKDIKNLFPIKSEFLARFAKTTLPVAVNELAWSLGISAYNAIYAHIGTESVAATNIAGNIENLAFVPFIALGNAVAIMIGNRIGAGEIPIARDYAKRSLILAVSSGFVMGVIMFLNRTWLLDIYKISDATQSHANIIIGLLSLVMGIKAWNMVIFIGVMRAGGDTRRALIIELSTMWFYGVPAAWIGANLFHLPVEYVVPLVLSEEVLKSVIVFFRFRSGKWIHHLAQPAT